MNIQRLINNNMAIYIKVPPPGNSAVRRVRNRSPAGGKTQSRTGPSLPVKIFSAVAQFRLRLTGDKCIFLRMKEYRRINMDGVHYYGKHLIATARGCNEALISIESVRNFLTALVDKIDMVAYGDPVVARFGQGIEVGLSAVQLIETSAIVIHTNDQARDMYLDVFSCKTFSEETVMEFLDEVFAPASVEKQILLR